MSVNLQDVFVRNGVPTHTFVEPMDFDGMIINLKTPGRPMVVEGPSGIGKTTAIMKAIEKLELESTCTKLSARNYEDIDYISMIPELVGLGIVIIDDFHKLPSTIKVKLADYAKFIADQRSPQLKIIVIGINDAGKSLIELAPDLVNRIDVFSFEKNPDNKILELVLKGESALNVELSIKDEIVRESSGSFYIAQMLCFHACLIKQALQREHQRKKINISFETVRAECWRRLETTFYPICKKFSRGAKFKPNGMAGYMHILYWLTAEGPWSINLRDLILRHPEIKASVIQIIDKGHIANFIAEHPDLQKVFDYDADSTRLVVDDPQFVFFMKNISWSRLAQDIGYQGGSFHRKYDFALSFAGQDRDIAESIFNSLQDHDYKVFYDRNEAYRILSNDVENYLAPIYQSDAQFVICLLSEFYPKRIWTKFESENFQGRFSSGTVIVVLINDYTPDYFSTISKIGYQRLFRTEGLDHDVGIYRGAGIRSFKEQLEDLIQTVHDKAQYTNSTWDKDSP